MPLETPSRIVQELASRGYNAEREAVTLLAGAANPALVLEAAIEVADDDALVLTVEHVRRALDAEPPADANVNATATAPAATAGSTGPESAGSEAPSESADPKPSDGNPDPTRADDPPVSTPDAGPVTESRTGETPVEAGGSAGTETTGGSAIDPEGSTAPRTSRTPTPAEITGDITGQSTGTGEYKQFVRVFRDRYERLSKQLRGRVNHRPAEAIQSMPGRSDAEMIGLVNDIRSTASGHWLVELEDTTGVFPCLVMKDKDIASLVDELLMDECIAVSGTLADDAGILFVDDIYFPDVPRNYRPSTADRHVQAALISDVHVGSQEFVADAWSRFTSWLHTDEAEAVEYLLIAGDMVEGVGVYPNQDEELDIIDIYEQYERFSEHLKEVPGDMEIVMIPGNHDAVRLAEPQPGFDDELRGIMSAHDARFTGNPSTVTLEGVSILMYHGVSIDEVIAELPEEKANYDEPHKAMYQLLKKRHVAPQYGGHMRLAPEEKDYLAMDTVPDVFHTGHVHKIGWGKYHNVLAVNSGCWQAQTDFQKSVNIDPDVAHAPILDLDTLDMTVRKFI
ncbi:DNA-directed DNA polymerase II small subunit [Halobium salinum]|uniref:DNA polymerase II small subunit n=1 Tax=Halobium salinum TaxID=1364940 RepID=A0ABD5PGF5_9EURY|nr:DNA-directed DNA polymerase II small subunit [Halobium salinum]